MDLTVLDAGVLIAVLDNRDGHHVAAIVAVRSALDRGDALVLPVSAYAETLVAPHRRGREAVATVDAFVDALPATVEPITRAVAATAAELRARHAGRLRLPDALVVSTALVLSAVRIVTTDADWPPLPVTVELVGPSEPEQSGHAGRARAQAP